jgi:prepilin-type N-terminal cleavage/methylation domain-containing protein
MNNLHNHTHAGFTLIELLVVVSLSVMLMLTASTLFMSVLLSNNKATSSQQVKAEGEYALSQISFLIRNAIQLENYYADQAKCQEDMTAIVLKSLDGGQTILFPETDPSDNKVKIASNSGIYLTSGAVTLTAGPVFNCYEGTDELSSYVQVEFSLRKGTPGQDDPKEISEETFRTSVNVRSY